MQETDVGWDPMYEGHLPWFPKVFLVYLAVVFLLSLFRTLSLTWRLHRLQKTQAQVSAQAAAASPKTPLHPEDARGSFQFSWEYCYAKVAMMKNLSMLTFLMSVLVSALWTTEILKGAAMEKVTGSAFLAGAMAEVLTTFSVGIAVCAVLYALAMFCEGRVVRRKWVSPP